MPDSVSAHVVHDLTSQPPLRVDDDGAARFAVKSASSDAARTITKMVLGAVELRVALIAGRSRDAPLGEALAQLELGDEVPEELWQAVAEVLVWALGLDRKARDLPSSSPVSTAADI